MQHSFTTTLVSPEGTLQASPTVITADMASGGDFVLGASATTEIDVAFTRSKLQSIYLLSSVNVTVKTNSSVAPQDTIALTAAQEKLWNTASLVGVSGLFGGDVAKMYVVNAGAAGTMNIRFMTDVTP